MSDDEDLDPELKGTETFGGMKVDRELLKVAFASFHEISGSGLRALRDNAPLEEVLQHAKDLRDECLSLVSCLAEGRRQIQTGDPTLDEIIEDLEKRGFNNTAAAIRRVAAR